MMQEKIRRLEKDRDEEKQEREDLRKELDKYVTHSHFQAVIDPLRRTLELVQKDVKEILRAVSHRE